MRNATQQIVWVPRNSVRFPIPIPTTTNFGLASCARQHSREQSMCIPREHMRWSNGRSDRTSTGLLLQNFGLSSNPTTILSLCSFGKLETRRLTQQGGERVRWFVCPGSTKTRENHDASISPCSKACEIVPVSQRRTPSLLFSLRRCGVFLRGSGFGLKTPKSCVARFKES